FPVNVIIADDDLGFGRATTSVTVRNVDPFITDLSYTSTSPKSSFEENDTLQVTGAFDDAGALDDHVVEVDWGDGRPSSRLALPAGEATFSFTTQYLADTHD